MWPPYVFQSENYILDAEGCRRILCEAAGFAV
jgi:hypothetical protein